MEELEFYKEWCLAHLKFDKEIFLKGNFFNEEAKGELVAEVRKVEDKVLIYYNNKNISRCSKLIAYMNLIKRLCFQMPLRPLLARMPSSHRSCSPLHSLFGAEHTDQNMA